MNLISCLKFDSLSVEHKCTEGEFQVDGLEAGKACDKKTGVSHHFNNWVKIFLNKKSILLNNTFVKQILQTFEANLCNKM